MNKAKLSPAQLDIIWKMQHGRQLQKYGIWCGDPSYFTLGFPEQMGNFVHKGTVNSLINHGLVEVAESGRRVSVYRLTEAGRNVVVGG